MQAVFLLVGIVFNALLIALWIERSKTQGQRAIRTYRPCRTCASARRLQKKLAIIPFENLNEDEGDGLLVDGIVEDLITEFSMIKT